MCCLKDDFQFVEVRKLQRMQHECRNVIIVNERLNRLEKEKQKMNTFEYIVVSIDGDYANLKRTDVDSEEIKLVARALLPAEITEGSRLKYEWMQYEIIE